MKKGEFIFTSKRMVKEYVNRYVDGSKLADALGIEKITINEVQVIGFYEDDQNYRILLIVPISDQSYYEVTYNKETEELDSYIFKKGRKLNGKRSRNRYFERRSYYHKRNN